MHLLLLRSLFREIISDLAGPAPTAEESNRGGMTRYLIVVARTEPAVYESVRKKLAAGEPFLRRVLAGDKIFIIGGEDELGKLAAHRKAQGPRRR